MVLTVQRYNYFPNPPRLWRKNIRMSQYVNRKFDLHDSLNLKVEARALDGIGTNLTVGDGHVLGVNGITLQGFFALQCAVEHYVGIR
jgi:hypothetical protein